MNFQVIKRGLDDLKRDSQVSRNMQIVWIWEKVYRVKIPLAGKFWGNWRKNVRHMLTKMNMKPVKLANFEEVLHRMGGPGGLKQFMETGWPVHSHTHTHTP